MLLTGAMMRAALMLFTPFAALAAAWFPLAVLGVLPFTVLAVAPYGAVAVAAAACWRFRRSRAVPVLALAAFSCWFAAWFPQGLTTAPLSRVLFPALALLLPVNVLLASFVGDRGRHELARPGPDRPLRRAGRARALRRHRGLRGLRPRPGP